VPQQLAHSAREKVAQINREFTGLAPLTAAERRDLLEILEDRTERVSTLITSQVPVKGWHDLIGEPTHADAICDRLIHTAYVIELQGPSLRETRARAQQAAPSGGTP
jgi:DNA replication protein DnaC